MKKFTLDEVKLDKQVKIENINGVGEIKRRLLDLGMVKGTKIKPVLRSPFGDPTAYEIRGTLISLREEDARQIDVSIEM